MKLYNKYSLLLSTLLLLSGCATMVHQALGGTIQIKIIGDSNSIEINHVVIQKNFEEGYRKNYPAGTMMEAVFSKSGNIEETRLPWTKEIHLNYGDVLYLQVKPIEYKDAIYVEIWEGSNLLKKYNLKSKIFPFRIRYSLD